MQVEVSSVATIREAAPTTAPSVLPSNPRKPKYIPSVPDTTSHLGESSQQFATKDYDDGPSTSKYTLNNQGQRRPKALQNLDMNI
ncbi:hypothetical protein PoB_004493300 [Plakobranchus ocellatus]|uniref:Uncharacterized protein n=1 Tax=Plakobranchus ocellatus TaxID=259542 RepID=A0AAV4BFQ3_9GAST|nr:hypothetical protein PoB_004493300 [Plakobranchus ocellatus]